MKRSILCALVLAPALAGADPKDPKTPDEWFEFGQNQYNLGNFDKAVEAFKKGFELEPSEGKKAAYLFNIAQAYRQAQNCKDAQFFYKRYLAFKDADTKKPLAEDKRKEIEDRIRELDECAKKAADIGSKPPDRNEKPDDTKPADPPKKDPNGQVATKPDTKPDPDDDDNKVVKPATDQPKVISLRAYGGGAKVGMSDLTIPVQATVNLIAGYPIAVSPQLTVDVGAGFTFTPLPFEFNGMSGTADLIGGFANAGATYEVIQKLGLRGELGLGALVLTGASESEFTNGAKTSGALTMLHVRVGVSADYAVTPNFIATVTPVAFSFSPAKSGLATESGDIKSITSIDFMVGVGYRM